MAELKPEIGLVIRHAYLWWNEKRVGREEGSKDRPCVIVHIRQNEFGEAEVFIAPITHTPPENPERAMAVPKPTKKRLGLDDELSWIITTEVNRFIWPGPDIRPVPGHGMAYGLLPANLGADLVAKIRKNAMDRSISVVERDDEVRNEEVRKRQKPSRKPARKTAKPRGRK
ncbi:MAG TPA: hypothetical protein VKA43_06515 [Gammaproteobacteria bacterium]|nr:hypothetical protein [Gammaproteobacteria bacterium]